MTRKLVVGFILGFLTLIVLSPLALGGYPGYAYSRKIGYYVPPATYTYTWYKATWYKGRWYPDGNYYYDGASWHLKGYGKFNGYDKAPETSKEGPKEIPETKGLNLSEEEIKKLKDILKAMEKK